MRPVYAFLVLWVMLLGTGCAGRPPINEFTYARTALEAAKRAGAPRYAPGFWSRAEESYRRAKKYYADRYYDEALEEFENARIYAEKSENATRLKKFKSGDGFL